MAGLLSSFAEAADDVLRRLAGVRLCESSVERATEAAGGRLAEALAQGQTFGTPADWAWHKDAEGKTVGYVLGDSTGVALQGPNGAEAEGNRGGRQMGEQGRLNGRVLCGRSTCRGGRAIPTSANSRLSS